MVLASTNPTDLTYVQATALLDTGATSSGIGPQIVNGLGLRSYEKRPLSVATEIRMVEYFFFRIGLFDQQSAVVSLPLPYIFPELDGFGWMEPRKFDVILGMDVLSQCDLRIKRNGEWEICFG